MNEVLLDSLLQHAGAAEREREADPVLVARVLDRLQRQHRARWRLQLRLQMVLLGITACAGVLLWPDVSVLLDILPGLDGVQYLLRSSADISQLLLAEDRAPAMLLSGSLVAVGAVFWLGAWLVLDS